MFRTAIVIGCAAVSREVLSEGSDVLNPPSTGDNKQTCGGAPRLWTIPVKPGVTAHKRMLKRIALPKENH